MDYIVIRPYRGAVLQPGAVRTLVSFALRAGGAVGTPSASTHSPPAGAAC